LKKNEEAKIEISSVSAYPLEENNYLHDFE